MTARHQSWVEVDLDAIAHNTREVVDLIAPTQVCGVVKADGYGHGAVAAARATVAGGATWLATAYVSEGVALREAGIDAPILVLFEPAPDEMVDVVRHRLTPNVYTHPGIDALCKAVQSHAGKLAPYECHVEIDTGMNRTGVLPVDALSVWTRVRSEPTLRLAGVYMHYAAADIAMHPSTPVQEQRFKQVLDEVEVDRSKVLVHACNSAAIIRDRQPRWDMARIGILIFGLTSCQFPKPQWLRPAMTVKSRVGLVKRLPAGESISYGHRYRVSRDSNVATVPFGYADGFARNFGELGAEVLINAKRYPVVGTVTMDQLMVNCGDDAVSIDDEVVLLGSQGNQSLNADSFAPGLGMTPLEFVTKLGPRLTRVYTGSLAATLGY